MKAYITVAALALASGCYDTYRVRPDELPKLNDSYTTVTGAIFARNVSAVVTDRSVRHLVGEDGRIVEVKGEASVTVETRGGAYEFAHPVLATVTDDSVLEIAGGNRAQTSIPLVEVRAAEVSAYSPEKTYWAAIGIGTLATIPLVLIATSAAHH